MRLIITEDNAGEYIIFLNGQEIKEAFEADEETGRIWAINPAEFDGYSVLYGDVSIFKKVNPREHTILGALVNGGSKILLMEPITVKTGDSIYMNITFAERGGIIESIEIIEAQ